jgi:hypothetical protein
MRPFKLPEAQPYEARHHEHDERAAEQRKKAGGRGIHVKPVGRRGDIADGRVYCTASILVVIRRRRMLFKTLVLGILAAILLALGSALFHMVRGKGASGATVRALTWRIGLSVGLFVLLIIAVLMGWITPHGIQP